MLSRVADALFWMSRYLERGEQVARMLDVSLQLDLDLHGVVASSFDAHWNAFVDIFQSPITREESQPWSQTVCQALTFDASQGASILSCVKRARNNARSIRGTISSDMWRELNKLYWLLNDTDFRLRTQDSPHDLYDAVEIGSQVFQGVCDSTVSRDEGWHFIQLGKYLERADKTLRILSSKMQQVAAAEPSVVNLHWGSVLRSCLAFQAYQRVYISRIEPQRVIDFLLFNDEFPHSVSFCLQAAREALMVIGNTEERQKSKAIRVLSRAVSDLEFFQSEDIRHGGMKTLLDATLYSCAQSCSAVQEQYFLV